jgi:spoIIIJ-associated protein
MAATSDEDLLSAVKVRSAPMENRSNCIETEGKTVDDAVANALGRLGVEKEEVEIEVLDEGNRGVFNILGSRQARVRVRLRRGPVQEGSSAAPAELVRELLSAMGFSASVECEDSTESTEIVVGSTGADGLLIGKRGETLESLQHIVSKMLNRGKTEWKHVSLDVGGYKKRRESQLVKLANSMADRVATSGDEETTEPLKASERRIIHLALKDHPNVRSFAVGEGLVKRVVIGPKETGRN